MKLRTFDGEQVRCEMSKEYPVSPNGIPVLLVDDEPFGPEEAEFFIESATEEDLEMLQEGAYDLPKWEGKDEGYEKVEEIETDD